jgi:hypothetical protein
VAKREYSGPWRRVRLTILARDGYLCQIIAPGCTRAATQVDHIVPVSKGGSILDPANLRAACARCNRGRVEYGDAWRKADTKVVLVVGPSCAGKTQYVSDHASPTDTTCDYDLLRQAVGDSHTAIAAARNALLRSIRSGTTGAARAWITSADPDAESSYPHHEVVVVDPGIDECRRRVRGSHRPNTEALLLLVDTWYGERNQIGAGLLGTASRDW